MKFLASYWFNRFQVYEAGDYIFLDILRNVKKRIGSEIIHVGSDRNINTFNFFKYGFLDPCYVLIESGNYEEITSLSSKAAWQFPVLTEYRSFASHENIGDPCNSVNVLHSYVGSPWAKLIDSGSIGSISAFNLSVCLNGIAFALKDIGVKLHLHTVCQHIKWEHCIPVWQELGITDVWLSHMPSYIDPDLPFKIHPWALYAVNVEDPDRQEGLEIGKDPISKKLLASFIGAHAEGYISDIRLRLRKFTDEPDFLIRVIDKWHFEDIVYKHQVEGLPLEENYFIDDNVREYNSILSDSIFALCPSGAGPNSIRLWEALAVGSIPVLLGKFPVLPRGGSLPEIDWESIVLKIADDQLPQLPQILRSMPINEVRARQKRGMEAYALVCEQRCF
jgi:hypothetical protein